MTSQLLSVHVPFSSTDFQMGSAVGGPGASLQTAEDVLVDSVGVMAIQSKAAFVGQTSAALAMRSASIQKVHSQAKVEIYAGGGIAPSSSGPGGPVKAPDAGPPGATMEKATGVACAALGIVSAGYGIKDACAPGEGVGSKIIALGVSGVAFGSFGLAIGAAAGAGGAASGDIEERASANIKQVAGKKISGIAPAMISSKTPGKFEVKALLVTDFTTTLFSNFALAKLEVKSLVWFKTISSVFTVKALDKVELKTVLFTGKAAKIKMDGDTKVTKIMNVTQKTTWKDDVKVEKDTLMHDKLTVSGDTEVKGKLTVKSKSKVVKNFTADDDVKTDTIECKDRVTLGAPA